MVIKFNNINNAISFAVIVLTVFLSFLSFIDSSFGTKALLIALILTALNFSNLYLNRVLPSMLYCFFALFLLVLSGQMSVRGFNAPINNAMKFVYVYCTFSIAVIMTTFTNLQKKIVVVLCIISGLISAAISTYSALIIDPYAIRYAAERNFNNVVDFNQLYGLTLLLISLFWSLVSHSSSGKIFIIVSVFAIGTCVFSSLFSTAILLLLFGVLLCCLFNAFIKNNRKNIFVIFLLIILFIIIILLRYQLSDLIYDSTKNLNWIVRDRFRSVADLLLGTDHGISYSYERRQELSNYSITSFINHPLFGVGYDTYRYGVIGCHQEWQDLLGVFGLVGTSIVVLIFLHLTKVIFIVNDNFTDRISFLISLILFFILGFLNPCLSLPVLISVFVVAPNISSLKSYI